jgi:AraC-like DNA-binding protein
MSVADDQLLITWPNFETPLGQICFGGTLRGVGGTGFERYRTFGMNAIVLLCSGSGAYRDETGYSAALSPGNLILVDPVIAHQYGPGPADYWDEVYVCFRGDGLVKHLNIISEGQRKPVLWLDSAEKWRSRLLDIIRDPPSTLSSALARISQFHVLLSDISSALQCQRLSWVDMATTLLTQGIESPEQVARRCGLTYPTFRRQFRNIVGVSPGRFRRERRFEKVKILLANTNLSLSEIADQCGFFDAAHLSSRFNQRYNASPSDWRRHCKL